MEIYNGIISTQSFGLEGATVNSVISGGTVSVDNFPLLQGISGTTSITGYVNIGNFPEIQYVTPTNLDAAGRQRVSQITNLGDYKVLNGVFNTFLMEQVGTATFTTNTNNVNMSVTSGQYGIIRSKMMHPYLNGKSQIIQLTGFNLGNSSNVQKSIGYYSSDAVAPYTGSTDGFRLNKDVSNNYSIQVLNNGTTLFDLPRNDWYDKLDGSGPSGMNIDFDKFNVFTFDYLWLGGTTLRCYVHHNGKNVLFAYIYLANNILQPFIQSPNKEIRYEIRSTTGSGNMNFVCATVGTEGQINSMGLNTSIKGPSAGITLPTAGTKYAICGVRKLNTQRDIFTIIEGWEGIISTNDFIDWEIMLNPTIAGTALSWSTVTNAPVEFFQGVANNTVTGGYSLGNTYSSLNMNNARVIENVLARLNSTITNTMDTIVLCATPSLGSGNVKVTGSMQIRYIY